MRFLIAIIIGLSLVGCSNNYPPPPPPNTGKYAPEVNPKPKYYMTVQGYIDPQLKNKIPLKIIATYYTTNSECDYYVNKFEGVTSYRQVDSEITVKTNDNGKFKYSIPLDFYKPGFCKWNIVDVSYLMDDKTPIYEGHDMAIFANPSVSNVSHIGTDIWICKDQSSCNMEKSFLSSGQSELIPNKNYYFTLIIRKKNDNHS